MFAVKFALTSGEVNTLDSAPAVIARMTQRPGVVLAPVRLELSKAVGTGATLTGETETERRFKRTPDDPFDRVNRVVEPRLIVRRALNSEGSRSRNQGPVFSVPANQVLAGSNATFTVVFPVPEENFVTDAEANYELVLTHAVASNESALTGRLVFEEFSQA